MRWSWLPSLALLVLTLHCAPRIGRVSHMEVPPGFPAPAYDLSRNPIYPGGVALGRALFYDPILSRDSSVSCASCHSPFNAFAHTDHALSHGIGDSIGIRNAPSLVNLAWQSVFMWDGAINHLDMQALAPITHSGEMGETIKGVVGKLKSSPRYRELFQGAFGASEATGERMLKALAQFQLTLVSAGAKYDRVKRGDASFTVQEEQGYALFRRHCADCHAEPLFTDHSFAWNGLPADPDLRDNGRQRITGDRADSLRFKVPTLRNLAFTYPYMHDGRFRKLGQALRHYVSGIPEGVAPDPRLLGRIPLDDRALTDLTAFLMTLNDTAFVFNPSTGFPR